MNNIMITSNCEMCRCPYKYWPCENQKFCGQVCYWKSLKNKKPFLGKHHTPETKEKLSNYFKGKRSSINTEFKLGSKHTEEWKKFMSTNAKTKGIKPPIMKGELNNRWLGGITPINEIIRKSSDYKSWRTTIFKRDNYTCQLCSTKGGILHVDHIKPFSLYPELRLDVNNGRTLCKSCHLSITKNQLKEIWRNQYGKF